MSVRSGAGLRWAVFGLAAFAFWLAFFHRVAPAAIAADLTQSFDVSGATLGALAATYFYVYALMQLPTGVLVDTLGPRRVLTAGGFIAGIGSLVFGAADGVAGAAAGRMLAGLGVSVAFVSMLKLTASWFPERRFSTVAGIGNVIGLSGALAATVPLAWALATVSWRSVFIGIGLLSLAVAALTWWLAQDHPPDAPAPHPHPPGERWYHGLALVMRNRATWPPFWVSFGISGSYMSFVGLWVGPLLIEGYGYGKVAASQHTAVMIVSLAVSSIVIGYVSDRIERRRPLVIASCLLAVGCWCAWLAGVPRDWTYALCAATGMSVTGFTLCWACAKEVNPRPYAGMATSLANCGGFFAAGLLQWLVGWLLDLGHASGLSGMAGFRPALAVLVGFSVIGLAGSGFIRETRCRNIWDSNLQAKPQ